VETYDAACRELARLEGLRDTYDTRLVPCQTSTLGYSVAERLTQRL